MLELIERTAKNKNDVEYTYMSLNYVKKDGTLIEIKRVFLSELERQAIKMLEDMEK
jgi:hypothetical protein